MCPHHNYLECSNGFSQVKLSRRIKSGHSQQYTLDMCYGMFSGNKQKMITCIVVQSLFSFFWLTPTQNKLIFLSTNCIYMRSCIFAVIFPQLQNCFNFFVSFYCYFHSIWFMLVDGSRFIIFFCFYYQ